MTETKTYLMTMTPLEPFAFGTERNFKFEGREGYEEEFFPYFIRTNSIPEQTTILGMLRHLILKLTFTGLKSDFNYSKDEKQEMARLIGSKSFNFANLNQTFGLIEELSPLFLVDKEGGQWVTAPFNGLLNQSSFLPMNVTKKQVTTSHGQLAFPSFDDYDVKSGYLNELMKLGTGELQDLEQVIQTFVQVGNHKYKSKEGFFKREVHQLVPGYAFAAYVTLADDISPSIQIMPMGQKKSLFQVELTEARNDLVEDVRRTLQRNQTSTDQTWHYALSDLIFPVGGDKEDKQTSSSVKKDEHAMIGYDGFAMIEKKIIRNLHTSYDKGYIRGIKRSASQYCLIKKGSVFYGNPPKLESSSVGYNQLVKIGKEE